MKDILERLWRVFKEAWEEAWEETWAELKEDPWDEKVAPKLHKKLDR